jgi:hypothetical protein
MPVGVEVTVPVPFPTRLTVTVFWASTKFAVAVVAAVIDTVHWPVPVHPPPDQPMNNEPAAGLAVRVTLVP